MYQYYWKRSNGVLLTLAAPVDEGMMLDAAVRPPRQSSVQETIN